MCLLRRGIVNAIVVFLCVSSSSTASANQDLQRAVHPGFSRIQCASLDDVDGDGFEDYVAVDMYEWNAALTQRGSVRIMSSVNQTVISSFFGPGTSGDFGVAVGTGDFDGNGTKDIVISVGSGGLMRLVIFDATSGALLGTIPAPSGPPIGYFGVGLELKDVNGDGKSEILCTSFGTPASFAAAGVVHLFNGGSGSLASTLSDPTIAGFGRHAHFLDDLTGDGVDEVLVASYDSQPMTGPSGTTYLGEFGVYDMIANTRIYQVSGTPLNTNMGRMPIVVDDIDGDGTNDFTVASRSSSGLVLHLFSGANGSTTLSAPMIPSGTYPVLVSTSIADQDGDGKRDVAIVSSVSSSPSLQEIDIYSSATLRLMAQVGVPGFGPRFTDIAVVQDVDGDGFEDMLAGSLKASGVGGELNRVSLAQPISLLAAGNQPGSVDLLQIDGNAGLPSRRLVRSVGQPFVINFDADPAIAGPTLPIIFGMIGEATPNTVYSSAFGDFVFPPRPAIPGSPLLFTLADSTGFDPAALMTLGPAPFGIAAPFGVVFPGPISLQGVSVSALNASVTITNAILLEIR